MRGGSKASAAKWLSEFVPTRFAEAWTQTYLKDPSRPMSQLGAKPLRALGEAIHRWPFEPSGTGGYKKAEVTVGGVDTDALDSKSMETKEISGLYFIGEVVDVTGWLGGYGFQWAWSSAVAAAGTMPPPCSSCRGLSFSPIPPRPYRRRAGWRGLSARSRIQRQRQTNWRGRVR